MDSRFTFKDFVFLVALAGVGGSVLWTSYQYGYQEQRLNGLKTQLQQLSDNTKQQTTVLEDIRAALKGGVRVSGPAVGASSQPTDSAGSADMIGRIRRKTSDGGSYVFYPKAPTPPRDAMRAADYAPGDWLVQDLGAEPRVIAPFIEKDSSGQLAHEPVLESLVIQNPESFEFEPFLAESFEVSGDGLHFKFVLRKEICFSDGTPITADDVLFSYNTIMNTDVDCAAGRSYFELIKSCIKLDDRTIEFSMSKPYFKALEQIGGLTIISHKTYAFAKGEDFNKRGDVLVGSGPYVVEKWDRGQQLTMVRNEHYWGPRPTFDKLVFKFITNPQASFQAFQNGQIDFSSATPEQWVKFSTDPDFLSKFQAIKYLRPNSGYRYLGYNEAKPMFKDKETRQALTMLIDRKAIDHTIFKDLALEITSPFSPITPQNDPSIQPWPYDVEGAKKKLAVAGWKPGPDGVLMRDGQRFEFDLSMGTGNPITERMATYAKEQFAQAGIRMRITPWEFSVLVGRLDDRNYDAVLMGWTGGLEEDPYQIWHSSSIANKGSNFINFVNHESDALIEEGRQTLDDPKRLAIWHKWQALIHEEQPYTFLSVGVSTVFLNPRFKNTAPYKTGISPYDWYVPTASQKYH